MQAVQFQPRPHRPCTRVDHKSRAVLRVFTPEPLRHQHFDFPPQYLLSLIAKQLLQLRIGQNNFALAIGNRDGIGRRFQQSAEFLFGTRAVSRIDRSPYDFGESSGVIKHRVPGTTNVLNPAIGHD